MRIFAVAFVVALGLAAVIFALSFRDSTRLFLEFLDLRGFRRLVRQVVARSKFSLLTLVLFTGLAPAIFFLARPILPLLDWTFLAGLALVTTIAITLLFWSLQDIRGTSTRAVDAARRRWLE